METKSNKNVASGSFREVFIEDGFYVLKIQNDTEEIQKVEREIDTRTQTVREQIFASGPDVVQQAYANRR